MLEIKFSGRGGQGVVMASFKASFILNKATLRVLSDAGLAKIGS